MPVIEIEGVGDLQLAREGLLDAVEAELEAQLADLPRADIARRAGETLGIVDRAYILHDGHVLMSGTPEQIIADPRVREVYLGDTFSMS